MCTWLNSTILSTAELEQQQHLLFKNPQKFVCLVSSELNSNASVAGVGTIFQRLFQTREAARLQNEICTGVKNLTKWL